MEEPVLTPYLRLVSQQDYSAPRLRGAGMKWVEEADDMTSKDGYKKTGSAGSRHNCKVWAPSLVPSLPGPRENSESSGLLAHP
ncbi:hypothetical protein MDA_GLEAN10004832 [Myotis davidii]|uniref:Uncharacterized protein n=1 Tax=Myotis davidii TaxID=225400 RepID=L5MI48_MYODS|nr:hypothetical protein MDA_GLEAN10004832 [Myotis davidii]